jgi:hypothetical protein
MIFATSPLDLPQNEQRNPRAFIFAIIGQVSILGARYSRCAITSSIKPYSLACMADIILSRSTSRSTLS